MAKLKYREGVYLGKGKNKKLAGEIERDEVLEASGWNKFKYIMFIIGSLSVLYGIFFLGRHFPIGKSLQPPKVIKEVVVKTQPAPPVNIKISPPTPEIKPKEEDKAAKRRRARNRAMDTKSLQEIEQKVKADLEREIHH